MIDFFTPFEMEDMHDTGWTPGSPTMDEGPESEDELMIDNFCGAFCE